MSDPNEPGQGGPLGGRRVVEIPSTLPVAPRTDLAARRMLVIAGERVSTHPLPDHGKVRIGRGDDAGLRIDDPSVSRDHAHLFFEKGKRKLNNLGVSDVITEPRVINGYPTEKPVRVSEVLIQQSSDEGDIVVDPFAGSSSTGVAALRHGRRFAGNDLSTLAIDTSRGRLLAEGGVEEQVCASAPQLLLAL